MKTFGVSEAAARFPSALMGLATMLLVWFLARRMFGDSAGLRAGIVFAACPLALVLAREVIFDMTLTFFVTLAMVAFWIAEERSFLAPRFDVLMFAAMGVAVITKGFVGVLIPAGRDSDLRNGVRLLARMAAPAMGLGRSGFPRCSPALVHCGLAYAILIFPATHFGTRA